MDLIKENKEILIDSLDILTPQQELADQIRKFSVENEEIFESFISLVLAIYVSIAFDRNIEKLETHKEHLIDLLEVFPILKKCLPLYSELINLQTINPSLDPMKADYKQQELSAIFSFKY